jgi:hypothetical protein
MLFGAKYFTVMSVIFILSGCESTLKVLSALDGPIDPKFTKPAKVYSFDLEDKGIRVALEYNTRQAQGYLYKSRCAGQLDLVNYGSRNYSLISIDLTFYNEQKTVVAKDNFHIGSGLISGGKTIHKPDWDNPLDTADGHKIYTECPNDMNNVNARISAYQ